MCYLPFCFFVQIIQICKRLLTSSHVSTEDFPAIRPRRWISGGVSRCAYFLFFFHSPFCDSVQCELILVSSSFILRFFGFGYVLHLQNCKQNLQKVTAEERIESDVAHTLERYKKYILFAHIHPLFQKRLSLPDWRVLSNNLIFSRHFSAA